MLPTDLTHLIDFQLVLIEMQKTVIDMRKRNVKNEVVEAACARIDKLIVIYEYFEKVYFNLNLNIQKNFKLEKEISDQRNVIVEQAKEIDKLTKSLQWN